MKRLRFCRRLTLFVITCGLLSGQSVGAMGPVLISGVQVKGVGSGVSSQEAVEVRNYSAADVEVTNWCVAYASYTSGVAPPGGNCVTPLHMDDKVFLRAGSSFVLATDELTAAIRINTPAFAPDGVLSGGLANTAGQLYVFDGSRVVQDIVKWHSATTPVDGQVGLKLVAGAPESISFKRDSLQVTTFTVSSLPLIFESGGLYDIADTCINISGFQDDVPDGYFAENDQCYQIDICENIDGVQSVLPDGMVLYEGGCVVDRCLDLPDVQLIVPENYWQLEDGSCVRDTCLNIPDLQMEMPAGYYLDEGDCVKLEDRPLELNELMPNAAGADAGFEYIELYNPHEEAISLTGYMLLIGKNMEKAYALPADNIPAKGYYTITNAQLPYTLLNTTSQVGIMSPAGETVDVTSYENPKDDQSWSKIEGVWQYSNQPTPGERNLVSYVEEEEIATPKITTLAPCGEGKYRHPLTNRCRNIETDVVTMASCDSDEYRHPETNRCRKFATLSSSLTPCGEGQERNVETNRCRSVLAATSSLTPCQPGQERNPESNRCRKVPEAVQASVEGAAAVQNAAAQGVPPYVIATGAAGLALGYGVFEWRSEITRLLRRLMPFKK